MAFTKPTALMNSSRPRQACLYLHWRARAADHIAYLLLQVRVSVKRDLVDERNRLNYNILLHLVIIITERVATRPNPLSAKSTGF